MNPLDFTGERYIPGLGGCQIAYEHIHRYLFALRWADGRQVLDLACGVGYGASLLAQRARQVWAVDLDENAIRYANKDWCKDNVVFIQGDATQLPFCSRSMGLVVAMEALEHISDQEKLVEEIARVCSANGVALISTPNRAVYSDARQYTNPFHKRELYLDEFIGLLKRHFPHVEIAGQQLRAGSLLSCLASGSPSEVIADQASDPQKLPTPPMYFVAICSMEELREPVPIHSAYLDTSDGLFHESKQEINELGRWGKSLEDVIKEKDQIIRGLQGRMEEEVGMRDRGIREIQDRMKEEVGKREQGIQDLQSRMKEEVGKRDQGIQDLQSRMNEEVEKRDQVIRSLQDEMKAEIERRDQQIVDILHSLHQKEKEFNDRGRWALSLQAEVERRDLLLHQTASQLARIRHSFLYMILSRIGLLPK